MTTGSCGVARNKRLVALGDTARLTGKMVYVFERLDDSGRSYQTAWRILRLVKR